MAVNQMKQSIVAALALGLGLAGAVMGANESLHNPWAEVRAPTPGKPLIIGSYSAGCLGGAVSLLPDEGEFQLVRKSRRHYFAHPDLREFIKHLAAEVERRQYGRLVVGDTGQARGGPTTNGHASHQIGLDGDFWFWFDSPAAQRRLTKGEEENLSAVSMLTGGMSRIDPQRFGEAQVQVLKYVAGRPEVDRVFVHPLIKEALCQRSHAADWVGKIRPWWGHHYHFHVRLRCPADQPQCHSQEPLPADNGCGSDLDWWLSDEAMEQSRQLEYDSKQSSAAKRLQQKLAKVPRECKALLN